jgi:hypothetical protein
LPSLGVAIDLATRGWPQARLRATCLRHARTAPWAQSTIGAVEVGASAGE